MLVKLDKRGDYIRDFTTTELVRHTESFVLSDDDIRYQGRVFLNDDGDLAYTYLTGLEYIRKCILTPRIIGDMIDGARLLSIGAGLAGLERLLVEGFDVSPNQIFVVDRTVDDIVIRTGINSYQLNGAKKMCDIGNDFDFVFVYPSIISYFTRNAKHNEKRDESLESAESLIFSDRKDEIPDYCKEYFIREAEKQIKGIRRRHGLLKILINRLNNIGELHFIKAELTSQERAYHILKLEKNMEVQTTRSIYSDWVVTKGALKREFNESVNCDSDKLNAEKRSTNKTIKMGREIMYRTSA